MRQTLKRHLDSRCEVATQIDVAVARAVNGHLELQYVVAGAITALRLPPVAAPVRTAELWQHTCFEVFIRGRDGGKYYEFNFAPSTQWAAYRFDSYRSGMAAADIDVPRFAVEMRPDRFTLQVSLMLAGLPGLPSNAPWRVGLSAVIEEANGRQSHWALAHPPGKADFHHADCFACEVGAA